MKDSQTLFYVLMRRPSGTRDHIRVGGILEQRLCISLLPWAQDESLSFQYHTRQRYDYFAVDGTSEQIYKRERLDVLFCREALYNQMLLSDLAFCISHLETVGPVRERIPGK